MQPILIEFPDIGSFSREWLEERPERVQELLAQCKGRYPLCKCREPGLPLYIARRTRLYLARVPNSGPQHAPFCPSYEPDRALCGWSIYSSHALADCGEGRVTVKLGVPLVIRDAQRLIGYGAHAILSPFSDAAIRAVERMGFDIKTQAPLIEDTLNGDRQKPATAD